MSYRPLNPSVSSSTAMVRIDHLVGLATEPAIAEALHALEHAGRIEYVTLTPADTQRHRLRAMTDRGTEVAIALPRAQHLADGAVLLLEGERAIVVRMNRVQWLVLEAADVPTALELGYFAGNMHWKVEFDGTRLRIATQGPTESYLERLAHLMHGGKVVRVEEAR